MVIACIGFASKISEDHISFCGDKLKEASRRIMEVIGGREPYIKKFKTLIHCTQSGSL